MSETTGLELDNESTSGTDATIALGGPEAEGHPDDSLYMQIRINWWHSQGKINDWHANE